MHHAHRCPKVKAKKERWIPAFAGMTEKCGNDKIRRAQFIVPLQVAIKSVLTGSNKNI